MLTTEDTEGSTGQFAEEFLLVHVVLEGFAAIDEHDGDFVGVEAADFGVGVNVDLAPSEAASFLEFAEALLNDLAEVASLAGIDDDFAGFRHRRGEFSSIRGLFPRHEGRR
jgi:hypothetical protein